MRIKQIAGQPVTLYFIFKDHLFKTAKLYKLQLVRNSLDMVSSLSEPFNLRIYNVFTCYNTFKIIT